jgi:flagellar biosynthesis/type III secretory pathway protein FliH
MGYGMERTDQDGIMSTTPPAVAASVRVTGARVMKAHEFEAQLSAQAIRQRAEAKAEQIVKTTLERAVKIEEAARIKGERLGLEAFSQQLVELEQTKLRFEREAEQQLIQHVFSVVRQVLPSIPSNLVTDDMVRQLIRREGRGRSLQLRVSPGEVEFALGRAEAWCREARDDGTRIAIEIKADASLPANSCVMKSEFGSVTACLADQLDILEKNAVAAMAFVDNGATAAPPKTRTRRTKAAGKTEDHHA